MSLILLEGFDDGLRDNRWTTVSLPAPAATGNNRLGLSQAFNGNNREMSYNLSPAEQHATVTVGVWMRPTDTGGAPNEGFFVFKSDSGGTKHIEVYPTGTLQLQVRRGDGTVLGTTDIIWPSTNTNRYIEVSVTLHDTTGSVQIWSDGASVLNLTDVDTKNAGTKTVFDQFRFRTFTSSTALPEIDDIYITNGAGQAPYNANLGDVTVDTLFPNGNGNYSDFTGSDADKADNYLLVDEVTQDGDTTYVESGVDTERDSYVFDDLFYTDGTIKGVMATALIRNTGAADNAQISTRIASVDYDGTTQIAPASFDASVNEIWQVSPATAGDWTVGEVNAAEFGIENVV